MTKPRLVKVRALFYVLKQIIQKEAVPIFDTLPFFYQGMAVVEAVVAFCTYLCKVLCKNG